MLIVGTEIRTKDETGIYYVLDDVIHCLAFTTQNPNPEIGLTAKRYSPLSINGKNYYPSSSWMDYAEGSQDTTFTQEPSPCAFNATQFWFGRNIDIRAVQVQLITSEELDQHAKQQNQRSLVAA